MNKWICNRCGREYPGKPEKNEICNVDGCKGRFQLFATCKICGEWFNTHGATVCPSCADKGYKRSHGQSVTVKCAFCGREFQRPRANARGRKQFCNQACHRMYEQTLWIDRTCLWCGKSFKVRESSIRSTNATGHYCSRDCYEKSLHKEKSKYWRDGFERIKRKHFRGVQFCAICGTTKNIHIHHIIPFRFTQDNGLDNLIPLCRKHHTIVEHIWLPFIESFDNPEDAKPYVNNVLRSRQQATAAVLMDIMERVKAKRG
jgi:hypothetical protein